MLILDFDGVIVDSMEETLVLSYCAYKRISDISKCNISNENRSHFHKLRPHIHTANFCPIWESIFKNKKNEQEFIKSFRKLRSSALNTKKWLDLFRPYPEIDIADEFYVCTYRDEESTSSLLSYFGLSNRVQQIYSVTKSKIKCILDILDKENKLPEETFFVDDNVTNLLNVDPCGVKCYLANWGYCIPRSYAPSLDKLSQI